MDKDITEITIKIRDRDKDTVVVTGCYAKGVAVKQRLRPLVEVLADGLLKTIEEVSSDRLFSFFLPPDTTIFINPPMSLTAN